MLTRDELNRLGPPGFHLAQKEKDYVQYLILSYLSQSGFEGIFKGGTALQKAFGLPRYSEDLDFTLNNVAEPNIDSLVSFLGSYGFGNVSWERSKGNVSSNVRLKYYGPLYNKTEISAGYITFDFNNRELIRLGPEIVVIIPPYFDILPYNLRVMNRVEIVAEKISAIFTRSSARDLFDLYFLLHQGIKVDYNLVNKKLEFYKIKFSVGAFLKRITNLEKIWKSEISALTNNYLEFDFVFTFVEKNMKK